MLVRGERREIVKQKRRRHKKAMKVESLLILITVEERSRDKTLKSHNSVQHSIIHSPPVDSPRFITHSHTSADLTCSPSLAHRVMQDDESFCFIS